MTEKTNLNYEPVMHTDAFDYSKTISLRHRRETHYAVNENGVTMEHHYKIGGAHYIVHSIFPTAEKQTAEDKIKHLINGELDKVS